MGVIVFNLEQLRKPTSFVEPETDIKEIVASLFKEMKEFKAFGLAANQLGYNLRIFVMTRPSNDPLPPICIVNPIITREKGTQKREEYCLCLPGVSRVIKRPESITIKGRNQYFKPVEYKFTGKQAIIACHEVDHLCGKLIIDY